MRNSGRGVVVQLQISKLVHRTRAGAANVSGLMLLPVNPLDGFEHAVKQLLLLSVIVP
jgi:hypothetical protein